MPSLWKVGMIVLVACLLASMGIAIYRLATTPTEIGARGFSGFPRTESARGVNEEAPPRR